MKCEGVFNGDFKLDSEGDLKGFFKRGVCGSCGGFEVTLLT